MSEPQASFLPGLAAGAVAGLVSKGVTYPMDTVKALLQMQGAPGVQSTPPRHTWSTCHKLATEEGLRGFYRGFSVILVGVVPANIAYFGGYQAAKMLVQPDGTFWKDAAVGAMAQVLAGAVYTPLDIIKERMQVQRLMGDAYRYRAPLEALEAMWRAQGMRSMFKGYWATNAVWLPWNTLYIALYEQSKRRAGTLLQQPPEVELPAWAHAACSAGSAGVAAAATHPLDVVKTRLQVLSATDSSLTAVSVARGLWRQSGPKVFSMGLTARILNIAPGCALSWVVYEVLRPRLEAAW